MPYELRVGKDGYYVVNTDTKKRKNKHGMSKSKAKNIWPHYTLIKTQSNTILSLKDKKV